MELLIEEVIEEIFGMGKKKKKSVDDYINVLKNTNDKVDDYFDDDLMKKLIDKASKVDEGVGDTVKTTAKIALYLGVLVSAFMQIGVGGLNVLAGDPNTDEVEKEHLMQAVMPKNVIAKLKSNDQMLINIANDFQFSFGENADINLQTAYYYVTQNQNEFDGNENYNKILETVKLDKKELNKIIALFITKYSESIIGNMSYDEIDNEEDGYGE